MRKNFSFSIFLSIWLIYFIFWIPHYECPAAEIPIEEDPVQEEYVFGCEKMLQNYQIRQFEPGSRPFIIQSKLHYLRKPYWSLQWIMTEEYIRVENHTYTPSMKIAEMHNMNIKGNGVGIVIIANSPVNCDHKQIQRRCFAAETNGYSLYPKKPFFSFTSDKNYKKCSPKSIATAVAGIIGMTDAGDACGVGIAPGCIIGNIVIEPFSRGGSPEYCAQKLTSKYDSQLVNLFVHAWTLPYHNYKNNILRPWGNIDQMNFNLKKSQLIPHVMGAGDLGLIANSCQCNEYASTESMFVFGSVAYNGFLTPYSETCAALMGVTYSTSYGTKLYNNIVTIPSSDNVLPTFAPKQTTAVSAAVAGGIIALIIEFYKYKHGGKTPSVTDLAFLLAFSANSDSLQNNNMLWFRNGVNLKYSPHAGFGLPDLVEVARLIYNWTPMEPPQIYEFSLFDKGVEFRCGKDTTGRKSMTYTNNKVCYFHISNAQSKLHIQSVTVEITAKLIKRGAASLYLISPGGTVSCLLEGRPYDTSQDKYDKLRLRSNHFMGEIMEGQWTLKLYIYKENSKPTFHPLYSFKTESQSTSPPPVTPFSSKPDEKLMNQAENISSVPSSINPRVLPPQSTNGLTSTQNSKVEESTNPQLAPPPGMSSLNKMESKKGNQNLETKENNQHSEKLEAVPPKPLSGKMDSGSPLDYPKFPENKPHLETNPYFINMPVVAPKSSDNESKPPNSQSSLENGEKSTVGRSPDNVSKPSSSQSSVESGDKSTVERSAKKESKPSSSQFSVESGDKSTVETSSNKESELPSSKSSLGSGEKSAVGSLVPPSNQDQKNDAAPPNQVQVTNPPLQPPPPSVKNVPTGSHPAPKQTRNPNVKPSKQITENILSRIKFRFVLVESLPHILKAEQIQKHVKQRQFDFELMKIWVDFRHYLLAQTDPKNYGTSTVGLWEVYGFTNIFIQELLQLQNQFKTDSVASVSLERLQGLTGIDNIGQHKSSEPSSASSSNGDHPLHTKPSNA